MALVLVSTHAKAMARIQAELSELKAQVGEPQMYPRHSSTIVSWIWLVGSSPGEPGGFAEWSGRGHGSGFGGFGVAT